MQTSSNADTAQARHILIGIVRAEICAGARSTPAAQLLAEDLHQRFILRLIHLRERLLHQRLVFQVA